MSQFQFGNFENRGGGLYFSRMSQFQFWNFENRGGVSIFQICPNLNLGILKTEGGISIFQKCPNFSYLIVYFAILPSKMFQFGQHFSKMSEIQKCPKGRRGGEGSTLIGTLSQIFSIFYFDASPQ